VGYYWRCIKGFAIVARPLMELQSKEACVSFKKILGNKGLNYLRRQGRQSRN